MKNGKKPGWICFSQRTLKKAGIALTIIGGVLVIVFVPIRYWMALIGLILLLLGVALLMVY